MEVICKEHKKCEYKIKCEHAKKHNLIKSIPFTIDCLTDKLNNVACHCSSIYLRKEKLEKLKNGFY